GMSELATLEGGDEVGCHDMRTAREVDHAAAALQKRERMRIQYAARFARQRQQANERVRDAQHRLELGEALHAGDRLRPTAPAGDIEAERNQLLRRIGAEAAEAEDADRAVGGEALLQTHPLSLLLRLAISVEVAMPIEHAREH